MSNLFLAPMQKTCRKHTAIELIDSATVIKTMSSDYLIRVDKLELDLNLTDDDMLCVSDYGTAICRMALADIDVSRLELMQDKIEQLYLSDQ